MRDLLQKNGNGSRPEWDDRLHWRLQARISRRPVIRDHSTFRQFDIRLGSFDTSQTMHLSSARRFANGSDDARLQAFVPSGNVPSTCTSTIISGTPSHRLPCLRIVAPYSMRSETERPSPDSFQKSRRDQRQRLRVIQLQPACAAACAKGPPQWRSSGLSISRGVQMHVRSARLSAVRPSR